MFVSLHFRVLLATCALAACTRRTPIPVDAARVRDTAATVTREPLPEVAPDPTPPSPRPSPADTRTIIAGGGALPSLNQVSLAQDLALARATLRAPSRVLFASGVDARVQVRVETPPPDPFVARLSALLDDRDGRDARYVPAPVHAHEPATAEGVLRVLRDTLAAAQHPLTLYVSAHGIGGDTPRDAVVNLWEDSALTVPALAHVIDAASSATHPLRVVMTACFSGGFAELAFHDADARAGAARTPRCGLFAAPWDRESSGCDPNPDRRAQEGYGLHVLHALRGEDRDGATLPLAARDYDGDGVTSWLDAHTRARIEGRSIDVPTTTSERWLYEVERAPIVRDAPATDPLVREEDAVIAALSRTLAIAPTLVAARQALAEVDRARGPLLERFEDLDTRERALRGALVGMVLARFSVLDDPWHRDFAAQLNEARQVLPPLLDAHPATAAREALMTERDELTAMSEPLDTRAALALRLVRAHEVRALAYRVRRRGGEALATFVRLRTCERGVP